MCFGQKHMRVDDGLRDALEAYLNAAHHDRPFLDYRPDVPGRPYLDHFTPC